MQQCDGAVLCTKRLHQRTGCSKNNSMKLIGTAVTERAEEKSDLSQTEYRIAKMWEMFPRLHLPEKYGDDLIVREHGSIVLPTIADVARWSVRQLQQYFVLLVGEDPAPLDATALRVRVAQAVNVRLADRQLLQNHIDGRLVIAKRDIEKPQSKMVRVVVQKKKK